MKTFEEIQNNEIFIYFHKNCQTTYFPYETRGSEPPSWHYCHTKFQRHHPTIDFHIQLKFPILLWITDKVITCIESAESKSCTQFCQALTSSYIAFIGLSLGCMGEELFSIIVALWFAAMGLDFGFGVWKHWLDYVSEIWLLDLQHYVGLWCIVFALLLLTIIFDFVLNGLASSTSISLP